MKKILFLGVMILMSTCIFSQTVKKGTLLGLHKGTVTLSPNVTMAQFKDYYFNVYGAEFTKLFKVKMLEVAGVRGVDAKKNDNEMAVLYIFEPKARDIYFDADGKLNKIGTDLFARLKSYSDEANKLGKISSTYTDWEIQ
jgi:hypothetical protein